MIPIVFDTLLDDPSAVSEFEGFVKEYKNLMISAAYEVLNIYHVAEVAAFDALEAIARGFSKVARLDRNAQKAYAYRSARSKAISLAGKMSKSRALEVPLDDNTAADVSDDEIFSLCEETDEEILAACVEKLPPRYKDVLCLYVAGEMTAKEIADALSLKRETVKTRLTRGKAILKELVEEVRKNG